MKRKLTVTITRIRCQTASVHPPVLCASCPVCGREVELVSAAQAAAALEVTEDVLSTLNAAGRVHAFETVTGQLRFCKDSLFVRGQTAGG